MESFAFWALTLQALGAFIKETFRCAVDPLSNKIKGGSLNQAETLSELHKLEKQEPKRKGCCTLKF